MTIARANLDLLAKTVIISTSFAFLEQDLKTLGHIDPEEAVEIANHGGQDGQSYSLVDAMSCEMLSSEGCYL
jgi:hypothetical protein